ncbi:MAG: 16S rRNA (adenine(1518)-N(6)/adenine(1519)-N(6))-dimethyltransferase RsmA [Anaerolineae bacterium]|jgi:16S rRNA (adenine1518-N6/adenine1519-N6)-dimethyltransferase
MNVRRLLRQSGIRPDKALGQNFLTDCTILQRIANAAQLTADDIVLEIGAGTGALTEQLAQDAGHVLAVELDQRLLPILQGALAGFDNISLIQGDILKLNPAVLIEDIASKLDTSDPHYKVAANLPYYITSAVLRHLLEADRTAELMIITVQDEVARRLVARPGDMSVLAVSVQFYADPEILFPIKPGSFYPSPDVDSAVVRLDVHPRPPLPKDETELFFQVVRAGFSQRRKQLHNSLSAGLGERISRHDASARLEGAGIDPRRRAQTLSVEEWIRLTHALGDLLSA